MRTSTALIVFLVFVCTGTGEPAPVPGPSPGPTPPESSLTPATPQTVERISDRDAMVSRILEYSHPAVTDAGVLEAMRKVPRHWFVPEMQQRAAYRDSPLPIGHGQTISQPYIVALMTQLAKVGRGMKVLEVGTGSGYQAAVLDALGARVFSVEIVSPLAEAVKQRFADRGYARIHSRESDGYFGWIEAAPFDRILVTAASAHIPPPLVEQLKPGGRMVIPVGPVWGAQRLLLVLKDEDGGVRTETVLPVRFVPLTGGPERN